MRGFRAMVLVVGGVAALSFAACETAKDSSDEGGNTQEDAMTTGDTATADTGGGSATGCEAFCEGAVAACPEEDTMATCTHSCEEADIAPDSKAITCMSDATDCTAAHACWPMLYN